MTSSLRFYAPLLLVQELLFEIVKKNGGFEFLISKPPLRTYL
jgi:hypothetical protein